VIDFLRVTYYETFLRKGVQSANWNALSCSWAMGFETVRWVDPDNSQRDRQINPPPHFFAPISSGIANSCWHKLELSRVMRLPWLTGLLVRKLPKACDDQRSLPSLVLPLPTTGNASPPLASQARNACRFILMPAPQFDSTGALMTPARMSS
jgi:hypothetical protein